MSIRLKFVMLGNSTVGKTSLVNRCLVNRFLPYTETTIGASFNTKGIDIDNNKVRMDIWDTAGQERYRSLIPLYYRNADCILLCIDLSNEINFEDDIEWWLNEVNSNNKNEQRVLKIVGTKSDIKSEEVEESLKTYCKEKNIDYIESSSKNNINIDLVFTKTAEEYYIKSGIGEKEKNDNVLKSTKSTNTSWMSFCSIS